MTADSTNTPDGAKTIFNTVEIDFREAIKALSREDLEKLASDQCTVIGLMWDSVVDMRRVQNPPSRDEMLQIAGDMLEVLDDDSRDAHEIFYGGTARERLKALFPALRGEGGVA
ncbi:MULTISPECIES: hypothetical protein [Asaia]|uniref:Uncharacterized protein n=1 Tax=Asaia bogorensis TaxID=91915 RepID=A0A060QK23_9PROT|nr:MULTISPECIES: hypothetical protein [Asaia]ETD00056.1 hypothetical protein P792_00315 [Asaia sp. SF2.1]CDG39641.1 hypothetical protein ASAP_1596 [Asaia bogorensis]